METTFYLMGSRMSGLEESLQVIANNLANTDTPGFKRSASGFSTVLESVTQASAPNEVAPIGAFPMLSAPKLDLSQGPIRMTGRSLDVAIQGEAFFVVDTSKGQRYTRKGRMYQNEQGELTDNTGNRIVSKSGALKIPSDAKEISVSKDGTVSADGNTIGQILLMDIPEPSLLVPEGAGLLRNDGKAAKNAANSAITQGAFEESNVKPMHEMVALIEVSRAYEAAARIMHRAESLNKELVSSAST